MPRRIAFVSILIKLVLLAVPLRLPPPSPVKRFLRFSMVAAGAYFPVKVVWEGKEEDYAEGPFVIGYEPHSVLPQGICIFSQFAVDGVPPGLKNTRILVSSSGLWAPIMRHMWWWLGCRPVSRACFQGLLAKGRSVAVCPGGVKECLYMQRGREVAYLRKRRGFVRLALQAGAPLVPVWAFGQTDLYSYCRLFYDWPRNLIPRAAWASFVRRIGYVPLIAWGAFGSFMPKQVPMYIVVGKPLRVPRIESPTTEQVDDHLQQFIEALERLFAEHKEAAGQSATTLTIY
ncbi:Diacylglycerol O-acyltransferase 2 [Micractinium conductrix]|uniref:Diacylglycerol O-acyltransferase 2 n=1 Tax=Micractinium conductrix TaxID=554055 RepID=A0A2P6V807_9CHLO|nr:Diacylglycerol O-acyltransferase 2 [Micractinium conductrix]|eukprot:PSC70219.1 Diacylglycerol O-acyltransferase 2 [Micractinium conductrix]